MYRLQIDGFLLDQIQEATRCGDQELNTQLQFGDLGLDIGTAVDAGNTVRQVFAVGLQVVVNLDSEFAGWCEDKRANRVFGRGSTGIGVG